MSVIKAGLNLFGAAEFVTMVKPLCLPAKEKDDDPNNCHTNDEKNAVHRHSIALFKLALAFQNNTTLLNYIDGSKEPSTWPRGRTWLVFLSIERYMRMTTCQINKREIVIAKQVAMESIQWQQNSNVNEI